MRHCMVDPRRCGGSRLSETSAKAGAGDLLTDLGPGPSGVCRPLHLRGFRSSSSHRVYSVANLEPLSRAIAHITSAIRDLSCAAWTFAMLCCASCDSGLASKA